MEDKETADLLSCCPGEKEEERGRLLEKLHGRREEAHHRTRGVDPIHPWIVGLDTGKRSPIITERPS
jgi:hypothetical protein